MFLLLMLVFINIFTTVNSNEIEQTIISLQWRSYFLTSHCPYVRPGSYQEGWLPYVLRKRGENGLSITLVPKV